MLRFITNFQRKRLERISTAVTDHAIVHRYQQASTEIEEAHRNHLFLHKVKTISRRLFFKVSNSSLDHELGTNTTNAGEPQSDGEVLHDGEPWDEGEEESTFNRFQDLPIELRVSVSLLLSSCTPQNFLLNGKKLTFVHLNSLTFWNCTSKNHALQH